MKKKIKNLRIQIDGLAQLTKDLGEWNYYLDLKDIPEGMTIEDYAKTKGKILSNCGFINKTQEVADATKSLYFTKAWLGKLMGELGAENPYKSGYKTVNDIEPTADQNTMIESNNGKPVLEEFNRLYPNHIEKVDWLRTEISKLDELLMTMGYTEQLTATSFIQLCYNNARTYLCEAKFNLGFELERIKKETKEIMK